LSNRTFATSEKFIANRSLLDIFRVAAAFDLLAASATGGASQAKLPIPPRPHI